MYIRFVISSTVLAAFILFGWNVVIAEEVSVETDTNVEVSTEIRVKDAPKPPLQLLKNIRANVINEKKEIRSEMKDRLQVEKGVRADVKAQIKAESNIEVRKEMRAEEKERRAEFREETKEKREEARDGLRARIHNLERAHLGAIVNRLSVSIRYFDTMVGRIESRIEKLKGRGVDTTTIEVSLRAAVDLIAVAKTDVKGVTDVIKNVTDDSNPETVKAELRSAIAKATASVQAAHRALIDVAHDLVKLIKTSNDVEVTGEDSASVDTQN